MFLSIICALFDMIILCIYFHQILGPKKDNINNFLYFFSFVMNEIILLFMVVVLGPVQNSYDMYIRICVSLIITTALTFLHDCNMRHRIFAALSFQVFVSLSELIVYLIISMLPKNMREVLLGEEIYGAICSKIVLFIMLNIAMLFFEKRKEFRSSGYSLLVLIMPVLSVLLMLTIPIQPATDPVQSTLSLIGLSGILVANIVNYFLLQNIIKLNEAHQIESNLNKQIDYQVDKYKQLSTAYRDSRRLVHDTKKHYFMIREFTNNKDYDKISSYLDDSINDLESVYVHTNTGNLVIDSFVSNYSLIAKQEGIQFRTNLQINPNTISIKDYDLSIIIGNLLDNAVNCCRNIPAPYPRQISVDIITSSKELLIHIYNTTKPESYITTADSMCDNMYHGFGTRNVERVTLLYNGNYSTRITDDEYHAIVSIPIINK